MVKCLTATIPASPAIIVKRLTYLYPGPMTELHDDVPPLARAAPPPPLVALLSRLTGAFIAEFDSRLRESEFCALSLAHSRNVLRHLSQGPQRAGRLVELSGVTKQAISQQLAHLEANGYVIIVPDADDQRARLVRLTGKGARAQRVVDEAFCDIEEVWSRRVEPGELDRFRAVAVALLSPTEVSPAAAEPGRGGEPGCE